jgi:hypothetical protein
MHEQRAKSGAHVRAAPDANPFDRLDGIDHPFAMEVDAGRAKHAAKQQQIGNKSRRVRVAWHEAVWRVRVAWHQSSAGPALR